MVNIHLGKYNVKNKNKYMGCYDWKLKGITKNNPIPKSSWEKRVMSFCDYNKKVIRWGYEIIIVPYYDIDSKMHKYYLDFYVELYDNNNNIRKCLVEVKPIKDARMPKKPKNNNKKALKRYMYERRSYIKNFNKWHAADNFCKKNGLEFVVLTERQIF